MLVKIQSQKGEEVGRKTSHPLCYIVSPHAHVRSSSVTARHLPTVHPALSKSSILPASLPVHNYGDNSLWHKWRESDGEETLSELFLRFF